MRDITVGVVSGSLYLGLVLVHVVVSLTHVHPARRWVHDELSTACSTQRGRLWVLTIKTDQRAHRDIAPATPQLQRGRVEGTAGACDPFAVSIARNSTPCDVHLLEIVKHRPRAIDQRNRIARGQLVVRTGDAVDIFGVCGGDGDGEILRKGSEMADEGAVTPLRPLDL